jgi:VanZ family protein
MMRDRRTALAGLLVVTLGVWGALMAPPGWLPTVPNRALRYILQGLLHGVFHAALTWQAWYALRLWTEDRRAARAALIFGLTNAVLDELAQHWMPGRTVDWRDLLCNVAGVGLVAAWLWMRRNVKPACGAG